MIICNYKQKPKVILEDEHLLGPVCISRKSIPNSSNPLAKDDYQNKYILYFTLEKDSVGVKICDVQGKLIKDLSNMFMGKGN